MAFAAPKTAAVRCNVEGVCTSASTNEQKMCKQNRHLSERVRTYLSEAMDIRSSPWYPPTINSNIGVYSTQQQGVRITAERNIRFSVFGPEALLLLLWYTVVMTLLRRILPPRPKRIIFSRNALCRPSRGREHE